MSRQESISTKGLVGDTKGPKMAENKSASAISRRSARAFVEDQDNMEAGSAGQATSESRYGSGDERDKDKLQPQRHNRSSSSSISFPTVMIPMVDLGKDICGVFPTTVEDMGKQVIKSLQAAKTLTKAKVDGRPLNFGVVLPGSIYRSSFPMVEDFQFLESLGLKTIVTLVKKDYPPEFKAFMKANGIRHCVIDMQGTKKVEIPDAIMHSILQITLEKENHPLLIHCNHGKHRTGCAMAVIRHIAGWNVDDIVEEYNCYATPKIRDCDVKYITNFQVSSLEGLFMRNCNRGRSSVLSGTRMTRCLIASALALLVWFTTALFWQR